MTTIAVIGATGYAGSAISAEAIRRGHQVIGVSRTAPADAPQGMTVRTGSITDPALLAEVAEQASVIVIAVRAAAPDGPPLVELVPALLEVAGAHGARLGVVGGAGSLLVAPGGPALFDTPEFPAAYKGEAKAHGSVLAALRADTGATDWFYLSPAAVYGSFAPGERTGTFRLGEDLMLTDAEGNCAISGADYAIAFVDEIDTPAHHKSRFSVAY